MGGGVLLKGFKGMALEDFSLMLPIHFVGSDQFRDGDGPAQLYGVLRADHFQWSLDDQLWPIFGALR